MTINPKFRFELVNGILETNEWINLQINNPIINSTQDNITSILSSLKNKIPDETIEKLRHSINDYNSAVTSTAVLYGIQVSVAMDEVIDNPNIYSEYLLEQIIKKKKKQIIIIKQTPPFSTGTAAHCCFANKALRVYTLGAF